ncbi:hypothetical protein OMW55_04580 [Sphingomonas sp. BN140010]|uniref:HPr kinase n=1 Tax=Sphingomonas arvum TaxID=2992113 RepID=A0ABT3JE33_9SPHN|nr:hypothetical protein [Sphingomonas sp. BN140010]MCW3797081.1 hypothetical protein [Sphingomonas sp. BN140010]
MVSDLTLPELQCTGASPLEYDVILRVGGLPSGLPTKAGLHQAGGGTLLNIAGVGRYYCASGRELRVEPLPEAPARNVRLFLLGSGLAMLLHRRGLLPLHGNSVVIDGRAYVFLGPSGSGKSSLAAWLHDRGHRLMADDVSVVAIGSDDRAEVRPGLPRLRLWQDAVERSGRTVAGLRRSFDEPEPLDKFDLPVNRVATDAVPLGGVLLLARGGEPTLAPIRGMASVQALFANIYRGEYLRGAEHQAQWQACVRIARTCPVWSWKRRWDAACYDEDAELLVGALRNGGEMGAAGTPASA